MGDEFCMPPKAAALPEAAKTIKPGLRPVGNAPLFPCGDFSTGKRLT